MTNGHTAGGVGRRSPSDDDWHAIANTYSSSKSLYPSNAPENRLLVLADSRTNPSLAAAHRPGTAPQSPISVLDQRARTLGCLLGGAVGDALGAPLEFLSRNEIGQIHGAHGLADYHPAYGGIGRITDDTQMTLFTAEGLLRAHVGPQTPLTSDVLPIVHHAYLRWLLTQAVWPIADLGRERDVRWPDGWLVCERGIWSLRNPCGTCLDALANAQRLGEVPHNDARDCGAVTRMAPVGLLIDESKAFEVAVQLARLTHGHPTACYAAGFLAEMIAWLAHDLSIREAAHRALERLVAPEAAEVRAAVGRALRMSASSRTASPERIESLGTSSNGAEVLAIAVYCALAAESFEHGVLLAINHGGKSDSTGALVGSILGVALGIDAVPTRWLDGLELHDTLIAMAGDISVVLEGEPSNSDRYPHW